MADDDDDDFFIFCKAVTDLGLKFRVDRANNGEQLLETLRNSFSNGLPDLILLDINMPKVNGMEALESIRANPAFNVVPVLMYTTGGCKEQMKACMASGANGFINKDCHEDNTRAMLNGISVYLEMFKEFPESNFVYNTGFQTRTQ